MSRYLECKKYPPQEQIPLVIRKENFEKFRDKTRTARKLTLGCCLDIFSMKGIVWLGSSLDLLKTNATVIPAKTQMKQSFSHSPPSQLNCLWRIVNDRIVNDDPYLVP